MAEMSIAVPVPKLTAQRVEAISAATETTNDSVAPLDFSFLNLTCLEDAEREEPRSPCLGRAPKRRSTDGKYTGQCLRLNNNQLSDTKTMKTFVEKMFINPTIIGWIDLSFNAITTIDDVFQEFCNLQILYLHGNNISNLRDVDKLGQLPSLRKLMLHGNEIEKEKGYRMYVLSTIPWLRNFDGSAVTKCDSRTAETWRRMNNPNKKKKKVEAED